MRKTGLSLSGVGIVVFCLTSISGCGNARTIAAGGGGRFNSCYAIGFSDRDVAALYDSATIDQANGFSYYEESRAVANACADSCGYETVCANGCTSCAYEIINAVYYKSREELLAKSSSGGNSAVSAAIKDWLSSNR